MVGIGKGGAGYRLDSQVIEIVKPGFQAGYSIPEAASAGKLHKQQVNALMPAGKRSGSTARSIFTVKLGKNMSRNKFEHLMKYCVTMCHSPNSPCLINGLCQIHCIKFLEFSDFFSFS